MKVYCWPCPWRITASDGFYWKKGTCQVSGYLPGARGCSSLLKQWNPSSTAAATWVIIIHCHFPIPICLCTGQTGELGGNVVRISIFQSLMVAPPGVLSVYCWLGKGSARRYEFAFSTKMILTLQVRETNVWILLVAKCVFPSYTCHHLRNNHRKGSAGSIMKWMWTTWPPKTLF